MRNSHTSHSNSIRIRFGWWKTGRWIDDARGTIISSSPISCVRSILYAYIETGPNFQCSHSRCIATTASSYTYSLNSSTYERELILEILRARCCVTQYWNQLCCRLKICLYREGERKRAFFRSSIEIRKKNAHKNSNTNVLYSFSISTHHSNPMESWHSHRDMMTKIEAHHLMELHLRRLFFSLFLLFLI